MDGGSAGKGGASAGGVCVDDVERSALGSRKLALDAVRLRVRADDRREKWLGPSRVERRLRVDLIERIDLVSDLSTSLGEVTRVALEATAVAVTPRTTPMSVWMVMSPRVPVSSRSCLGSWSGRASASSGSRSSGASRPSDVCSDALSSISSSKSSNSMAIFSASRHASSSSSSRVCTRAWARLSS